MSQLRLIEGEHPDRLIERAKSEQHPVATVCLFSGGHDSTVLAHRCRAHYEQLAFIDTGTAIPGVREFVSEFAAWIDKPLVILEAGDIFRAMVLGVEDRSRGLPGYALGFPGPAQHGRPYVYLKERQLRALTKRLKEGHAAHSRVVFLSGVRRGESQRRRSRLAVTRDGARVYVCPLIDWSDAEMRDYRAEHDLPESDVAALLHRSGECNCGSFAAPGEREELASLWPEWFETTIASLECEAEARGIPACRWGERPRSLVEWIATGYSAADFQEPGPLCSDCQLRMTV